MKIRSLLKSIPGARAGRDWLVSRQEASKSLPAQRLKELKFEQEFKAFNELSQSTGSTRRFSIRWEDRWPCLEDRTSSTGFDRHYIYHPAWAARIISKTKPAEHTDISSTLVFCSILSAFVPVRFFDFRPADLRLDNLLSATADLLNLPFRDDSIQSLSCMHVVEHIGLGRYGDPLDPDGDVKAMRELRRVLAPGGSLLIVVPVGIPRICFNAHRIYRFQQVCEAFSGLKLREFSLIPDDPAFGGLIYNATEEVVDCQHYGCGCFWFLKHS